MEGGGGEEADEMCVWKEEEDKTKFGYNWIYSFCRFYLNSPRDKSQGEFFLGGVFFIARLDDLLILKNPVNFILENKLLTRVGLYWPCLPRQGYCV